MRKALVTLSSAGIIASLVFSSCVIKKSDDGDDGSASGGTGIFASGGTSVVVGPQGGDNGSVGGAGATTTADPCPDLLKTLNPGDAGACAMSKVAASFAQINMLIVLDKSGSMSQTPAGDTKTKWAGAMDALRTALKKDDTLVKYGLLMYPYTSNGTVTSCELDSGDQAVNVPIGPASETVDQISAAVAATAPLGGTPTAAALGAALEYYTAGGGMGLQGSNYVLLVTDGGPNCNTTITCPPETCTANMDKIQSCGSGVPNCCDPKIAVEGRVLPQSLCLDDLSVSDKIAQLRNAGITTFVVGIPGTEAYATYLNGFAIAGGAPVTGADTQYYKVTTSDDLAKAFTNITTSLVRSCTVPLEKAPQDTMNINLAIDCQAVPQKAGEVSNWHYDEASESIIIEGTQCKRIETTGVKRVDVVNGCPPIVSI